MTNVAIVTDSTAYIPPELTKGYPISIVPLQVVWGENTYRDGIDITPERFYTLLPDAKVMPSTSQPSPAAFKAVYEELLVKGCDILSVHISSKLSGTVDSAMQARQGFPKANIEVIDSLSTSMGMGFPLMAAARAAIQGATLDECKTIVETALQNSKVFFLLNTLEFLRRGGRIGSAAAFVGTALDLKPILELRDGKVEALERIRTWNKGADRLLGIFQRNVNGRRPVRIAVIHANAEREAAQFLERARQLFSASDVSEAVLTPVSPVIGTHTGPGCLGIAFTAGF
jgi:DegV family protein with EDD domain